MPERILLLISRRHPLSEWLQGHYSTTVVHSISELSTCLAHQEFSLVVLTNYVPHFRETLSEIPKVRRYPVVFATGHVDDEINRECRDRNIKILSLPLNLDDFLKVVTHAVGIREGATYA